MYRVYGDLLSGNCYKIKLLMEFLGLEHEWQHIDILANESHTDDFLAKNASGKIPLLQINDQDCLAESNAILNFLAEKTAWLPDSGLPRARVLQWQFFEQYSHEPYIAVARYINKYLGLPADRLDEYHSRQAGGHKALQVMEKQLKETDFITGQQPTIADISLYAYTHVAHEGGFDLTDYPATRDWLGRFDNIPGYVPMPDTSD
ncbi:MAG: glutathione S-transferase family protein [Gammaproteobacteria bacterium]|nr:glutathione S-transferase family protein [Gammaproteobacteria bacterium]